MEYIWSMKRKTSVTLSVDVARALDRLVGADRTRSSLVEQAVRELIDREDKRRRDARELELINRHADRLNQEAADVLAFQVDS